MPRKRSDPTDGEALPETGATPTTSDEPAAEQEARPAEPEPSAVDAGPAESTEPGAEPAPAGAPTKE